MRGTRAFGILLSLCLLGIAGAMASQAQTAATRVEKKGDKLTSAKLIEVRAKVEAIDLATRTVTLRGEGGKLTTFVAGAEVRNLEQVKVGDEVVTKLYESLTIDLKKATGTSLQLSEKVSEERAEKGELPGGIRTHQIDAIAKVTAIDAAKSTITLVGPRGNSVDLEVDPEVVKAFKVGDLVSASYTEAVAIGITRITLKSEQK